MQAPAHVLCCECTFAGLVPEGAKAEAIERLRRAGVPVETVPDLCGLAARRDPRLKTIAESGHPLIIACYPRAVRWLFAQAGAALPESARIFNLRTQPPEALELEARGSHAEAAEERAPEAEIGNRKSEIGNPAPPWLPWFPVIDRSRCTGCQQCLNFCLFGVYALDAEGRVEVRNPANCKTNCPACARICPQVAIIFPKHKASPINGDEVTPEHLASGRVRVAPRRLGRGDVYAALRRRSARAEAPSTEAVEGGTRTEAAPTLGAETPGPPDGEQPAALCPCMLDELEKELGIPPEVIKSLPLSDIQARLRAARGQ